MTSSPAAMAKKVMGRLMAQRHRLPGPMNRLIDDVAQNPDGFAARVAARVLGGNDPRRIPQPTTPPEAPVRVYIGPTNYAGQGMRWARALEEFVPAIGARNMAIELPGGFDFGADTTVPVAVHTISKKWQQAEFDAVRRFTHVLFEAERPLFGPLFARDVGREISALEEAGVSCAFMCHGTDIRSPRLHMSRDMLSPYFDDPRTEQLQRDADANLALLRSHDLPVFVSTPDLLIDVPAAVWCPVVVEHERWRGGRAVGERERPIVAHSPSVGLVKGTHLIEPVVRHMHDDGMIEYRGMTGIKSADMPAVVGEADIVLDQFRIGSYGVAAVEAMAAGRVVVGHVLPDVRQMVRNLTGLELPVVEAVPETLRSVIGDLVSDRARMAEIGALGQQFTTRVHSGELSADALNSGWIHAGRA